MYFIITIDVEEDNWGDFENKNASLLHINKLFNLQELLCNIRIQPALFPPLPCRYRQKRHIDIEKDD